MLSFASVHQMIKAEKLLLGAGIKVTAIPTPREIDVSCGQCLLFDAAHAGKALALLRENRVRWSKLFSRDGRRRVYEKLKDYGG